MSIDWEQIESSCAVSALGRRRSEPFEAGLEAEANDRRQAGRWEGDLIMGPRNRSAVETLAERSTRFVVLLAFPEGVPSTAGVRIAICEALEHLPAGLRWTLTWDQGKELTHHQQIAQLTGTPVFFCDAHAPWQRGSNET